MNDLQAIVDRFEIEALRGEFTDAIMMRDHDRFAALFIRARSGSSATPPWAVHTSSSSGECATAARS